MGEYEQAMTAVLLSHERRRNEVLRGTQEAVGLLVGPSHRRSTVGNLADHRYAGASRRARVLGRSARDSLTSRRRS